MLSSQFYDSKERKQSPRGLDWCCLSLKLIQRGKNCPLARKSISCCNGHVKGPTRLVEMLTANGIVDPGAFLLAYITTTRREAWSRQRIMLNVNFYIHLMLLLKFERKSDRRGM